MSVPVEAKPENSSQNEEVSTGESIEVATEAEILENKDHIWTDEEGEISFKIPKKTPKKKQETFVV